LTLEQEEIAKTVFAANPHTIVVLKTSFPFTTTWTQENIPAIIDMTHNSEEEGTGLADVLFGDYNPAGRLTQTWVSSMEQLPQMMDYDIRHGRTYMYLKAKPLYAFGYGLSYTTFGYSNLKLGMEKLHTTSDTTVTVDVKNTGSRAGDEVVQFYVAYLESMVARPIEELKGFQRISLQPGETKTVTFPLQAHSLAYWNEATKNFTVEPGRVQIRIGSSSDNIKLEKTITVSQ
jgi:beta-glucosidase